MSFTQAQLFGDPDVAPTDEQLLDALARFGHQEWLDEQASILISYGNDDFTGTAWDNLPGNAQQHMRTYYAPLINGEA